jgi:uncharacterized phage protein (TIGR02218 family)
MKLANSTLIDYLNSKQQVLMADLYTIKLRNGDETYYASSDIDLTWNGKNFSAFRIQRGQLSMSIGINVDTLEIKVLAGPADKIDGVPWLNAVHNGVLDGAAITLQRVFMPTWGDTHLGAITLFSGRVSDVDVSSTEATLHVASDLELLNVKFPRNSYQSGCLNTLYDTCCGLDAMEHCVNWTVYSATRSSITSLSLGDIFTLGKLEFTSGANKGIVRSIREYKDGVFQLSVPLEVAPRAGDQFRAFYGCDKTQVTCRNLFKNEKRFRGFPYIPVPEAAMGQ